MTILCRTNICLSNDRFDSTIKRSCSSNAERRHKKKLKMQITCTYTVIDCVNFVLVGKYLYYRYLIFNCISLENQLRVRSGIKVLKWVHLCGELFVHSSEIRGLCLIEWPVAKCFKSFHIIGIWILAIIGIKNNAARNEKRKKKYYCIPKIWN